MRPELSGGRWVDLGWAGGGADLDDVGHPAAAQRGPASLLAAKGSSWGRSYLDRLAQPDRSRPGGRFTEAMEQPLRE